MVVQAAAVVVQAAQAAGLVVQVAAKECPALTMALGMMLTMVLVTEMLETTAWADTRATAARMMAAKVVLAVAAWVA